MHMYFGFMPVTVRNAMVPTIFSGPYTMCFLGSSLYYLELILLELILFGSYIPELILFGAYTRELILFGAYTL